MAKLFDNEKMKSLYDSVKNTATEKLVETGSEVFTKIKDSVVEGSTDAIKKITDSFGETGSQAISKINNAIGDSASKTVKNVSKSIEKTGTKAVEGLGNAVNNISETTQKVVDEVKKQKQQIEEKGFSESAMQVTQKVLYDIVKLPVVNVNREDFLRKTFGDSEYIDQILANGPQSVYSVESLKKKANEVTRTSTRLTSIASFAAGLPSNPFVAIATGTVDITQFFGFAMNLAQKIAYIFGEDQIFKNLGDMTKGNGASVPEDAQIKMIGYLGSMLGVSGASGLIIKTSQQVGANIGKKVASQALTKTTWYPIVKKVGSVLGYKITKKSVESAISKSLPVVGGVLSGGITYATFKPMGQKLSDVFVKMLNGEFNIEMELNEEFAKTIGPAENIDIDFMEGEFEDIIPEEE